MMRRIAVVLTALPLVSGFAATPPPCGNRFDTACAMVTDPESAMTGWSLLVAGTAMAAMKEYQTDKFEAVKDLTKPKDKKEAAVVPAKKDAAPAVVVKKSEPVVAAVQKVAAVKKAAPKAPPVAATPQLPDAPKPKTVVKAKYAAETSPTPKKTAASLTDLVQQVGNTVEKNKEIEDRVKARRMKEEEESSAAEKKEQEEAAFPEEDAGEAEPTKRGTLRKAWRLTKKVVAPWRKWRNIS
jgi:hypothetical protein